MKWLMLDGVTLDSYPMHETLFYQNNAKYLKDNSLHFQISYKDLNPPITYYQVAPVIVHMPGFTDKMKNGEEWFSVPFFAYERGYQMQLMYKFDDNYVNIFLILMKGPHDDNIQQSGKWPLRGRFAIELLNQLSYDNHWLGELVFSTNSNSECTNRVTESDRSHRFCGLKFISTDAILHPNIDTCDYFKDGSLYFRISYKDIVDAIQVPHYPVVPFTIKKSGQLHTNHPFFAFDRGYLMCLSLFYDPAHNHIIPVGLTVMKGPFDDELDQSGYWPLKGTFLVEILFTQYSYGSHYNHSLARLTFSNKDKDMFSYCAKRSFKDKVTSSLILELIITNKDIAKDSFFYHISYEIP